MVAMVTVVEAEVVDLDEAVVAVVAEEAAEVVVTTTSPIITITVTNAM